MKKKVLFVGGVLLVWALSVAFLVLRIYNKWDIGLSLLWIDIKNGFMDVPNVFIAFRNKVIVLTFAFGAVGLIGILTEKFTWNIKVFQKRFCVTEENKLLPICFVSVLGLLIILDGIQIVKCNDFPSKSTEEGWKGDLLIAHAGGGIGDDSYTNSRDAFEFSYAAGARTIELDFSVTSDGELVCWHDWKRKINSEIKNSGIMSKEEFLNAKIHDQYTSMALEDVFALMKQYEDVYVVTDTKDDSWDEITQEFRMILNTAEQTDSISVLDRFVVQLYNHDMYDAVEAIYPFPNYILTLYRTGGSDGERFVEHCRFCVSHGVKGITMWENWANPENVAVAKRYGLDVYVHTVNDVDVIDEDRAIGVRGFYTDFVYPDMIY